MIKILSAEVIRQNETFTVSMNLEMNLEALPEYRAALIAEYQAKQIYFTYKQL